MKSFLCLLLAGMFFLTTGIVFAEEKNETAPVKTKMESTESKEMKKEIPKKGTEKTYSCEKCNIEMKKAGKCPKCGNDLKEKKLKKKQTKKMMKKETEKKMEKKPEEKAPETPTQKY